MNLNTRLGFDFIFLCSLLISMFGESHQFTGLDITKRFEYKLSFKGPHLVFKDGTVPFWEHSGSTIASNDQIRITPSIRSQKGRIWSKHTMDQDNWEIEVALRINGRGRVGADGMAIWYTDKIEQEGPVFGSADNWNGLGVFLDSFDNDAQQNNPYILIMTNDGSKSYDHHRDGITQQLGGCLRDFRNKPYPVVIKIEYFNNAITVYYHSGLNNDAKNNYEICARVEGITLPKKGHFGVSAATGGLADDHDVLSFLSYSLVDSRNQPNTTPSTDEQKKYDAEYEQFLKNLELEKEKYNKEHPELKEQEIDEKKNFESDSDRQFRTILDVQNSIHYSIQSLDHKFAEVLGRQERIVSMLSSNSVQSQQNMNQQANVHTVDTFNRLEVNQVMTQQNELVKTIRDIYNSINDIQQKANIINERTRTQQQPQQVQQVQQVNPALVQQISDDVKNFRFEMNSLIRANQPKCPDVPSCLSTVYFIIVIVIQSILFFVYFIYKNRSESQLKKFY